MLDIWRRSFVRHCYGDTIAAYQVSCKKCLLAEYKNGAEALHIDQQDEALICLRDIATSLGRIETMFAKLEQVKGNDEC